MDLVLTDSCLKCKESAYCFFENAVMNGDSDPITQSIEHIEMKYHQGESIFKQGTIAPHIIYLKQGIVKTFLEHNDRKQTLCMVKRGFVGLESMYNDKYFQYSVSAITDVTVCLIEMESFKNAIHKLPWLGERVIESINTRTMQLYKRIITLTQKQAPGRVADIILCFKERIFESNDFEIPCSRKEFAEMARLSPESLSRVLKDFKEEEVVQFEGKRLKIVDEKRLEMISMVS
jgi:CRP-like cAMP-binding protein